MMKRICAAGLALLYCVACAAGEAPAKKVDVEKQVREGIIRFRKEMRSDDEKVRLAAFDRVMADKALLQKLFGKDAALVWPDLEAVLVIVREGTDKMKADLDGGGGVKSIKLTDVRKSDASGRFRLVLSMIPKDVPVYTGVVEREKDTLGTGTYVLVDGRARWVLGLEKLGSRIHSLKVEASRREAKFPDLSARFLAALRSEKLAEAMACWVSVKEIEGFMAKPPADMPKLLAEGEKKAVKHFRERDAIIAKWFPNLIKALKAKGLAPKDLKYADSTGKVRTRSGVETASSVTMTFARADGLSVMIRINDGLKLTPKGKWRFSDNPLRVFVVKDGKGTFLDVKRK